MSILSAGTFFGALIAFPLGDKVGRKYGLVSSCAIFAVGVGMQLSTIWGVFVSGRVIAGLGGKRVPPIYPHSKAAHISSYRSRRCQLSRAHVPIRVCTQIRPWFDCRSLPIGHHHRCLALRYRSQCHQEPAFTRRMEDAHRRPVRMGRDPRRWNAAAA